MDGLELELLVKRAKEHDIEAFAVIYQTVYKDLFRFAYYTLNDRHDAEDAVSETVADAFYGIEKLRDSGAFRGWIFKILTAKCKQRLKSYVDRPVVLEEGLTFTTGDLEQNIDLNQAFSKLNQKERFILTLSIFAGYKTIEISKMLHLNHNTVRSIHSRALDKMKDMLGH